jgi:hypothetical protein
VVWKHKPEQAPRNKEGETSLWSANIKKE